MIMHHIILCTTCITLFNYSYLLHIQVDHLEPESEFQADQVRWVFGGPQVSSSEDANIVVIKPSPATSNPVLEFCLQLYILL
jgi:hypothetical protein